MTPAFTLAQVIEQLPAHARDRYADLCASVADSKALVGTLMERFEATQKEYQRLQVRYSRAVRTGSDEATQLQAELEALAVRGDKLERERHRRNSIATNSEQIIVRVRSFIEAYWLGACSGAAGRNAAGVSPSRGRAM